MAVAPLSSVREAAEMAAVAEEFDFHVGTLTSAVFLVGSWPMIAWIPVDALAAGGCLEWRDQDARLVEVLVLNGRAIYRAEALVRPRNAYLCALVYDELDLCELEAEA